jgi:hypothetical protein
MDVFTAFLTKPQSIEMLQVPMLTSERIRDSLKYDMM